MTFGDERARRKSNIFERPPPLDAPKRSRDLCQPSMTWHKPPPSIVGPCQSNQETQPALKTPEALRHAPVLSPTAFKLPPHGIESPTGDSVDKSWLLAKKVKLQSSHENERMDLDLELKR